MSKDGVVGALVLVGIVAAGVIVAGWLMHAIPEVAPPA